MEGKQETRSAIRWLRQRGRLWLVVACAAIGLLLMLIGTFGERSTQSESKAVEKDWQSDIAALEAKAADLCTRVAGVSDVTVAVSLAQGVEYVYADEGSTSRQALLVTERPPQISGIGVVCVGGDDPATVRTLVSLLSVAFGVGSNRIYITPAG